MNLETTLTLLSEDPHANFDLAEISLALAQDEYPYLDVEGYLAELDAMAYDLKSYLTGDSQAQVHRLCRFLFHDMGFRGNDKDYYDPRNSYLNQVLDRRTGIPITLSAVAIAVGSRAGLEISGVGLPGHFVTRLVLQGQEFLFDPFHGGRQLTSEDCEILVERVTGEPFRLTSDFLKPVPVGFFIQRMLNNLKVAQLRLGDFARAARVIQRLILLVPDDPTQWRDLGISLLKAQQPGKAIDPLVKYLRHAPDADDVDRANHFLTQARSSVAQWN